MIGDQSQHVINHLLSSHDSQDIFLRCKATKVELVESKHVGHQFFVSLAEFHRKKFLDGLIADPGASVAFRTALFVLNAILDKGRGKLYVQLKDGHWKDVKAQTEARDYVFRALATFYDVKESIIEEKLSAKKTASASGSPASEEEGPRLQEGERARSIESLPPKKRVHFTSLDTSQETNPSSRRVFGSSFAAAQTLASMLARPLANYSANERLGLPGELHHTTQVDTVSAPVAGNVRLGILRGGKYSVPPSPPSLEKSQSKVESIPVLNQGITGSELRATDVIVGGNGVGALDAPNTGNRRFRALIESKIDIFAMCDQSSTLRMAQMTVEVVHRTGGRFLTLIPLTGLLHEIDNEKAWSKTLRTYRELFHRRQQRESVQRLKEAIQEQERILQELKEAKGKESETSEVVSRKNCSPERSQAIDAIAEEIKKLTRHHGR
jgi:hypothetical protein